MGLWVVRYRVRRWALPVALACVSCGLVSLPLVGLPGYEFSAALALMYGLVGTLVTAHSSQRSVCRTALEFCASMVPALGLAALCAAPCSASAAFGFWPVLAVVSAWLAAAAGVWVSSVASKWWSRTLLAFALILASAVSTVWPIVFGPQVFAFNHFGGYFPGPLYDETLRVTSALLWFRLGSVALALTFWGWVRKDARLWAPALVVFAGVEFNGGTLGFRMSDDALAERLGATRVSEHFVVHYPRANKPSDVDRFVNDLEFRHAQISAFLSGPPPGQVTVWLYRSAADKQRLVGAEHTQFSKPWRREVHVNEYPFPHPVIKHELMHAMVAPFGRAPFGVTATWLGLSPYVGIIEGMAVAGDNPSDELTLHEWAAAMRKQGLLPDVRVLLQPSGFYSAPASRAYSAAGSFLRWLGDTRGGDRLRALYREGDFGGTYGQSLPELVTDWERFLDGQPLEQSAVNQAFARFKQGSLFERPCAREVALLTSRAAELLREDPAAALDTLTRCHQLQPAEPAHELAQADALRRLGRDDEARALLEALAGRVQATPTSWAEAALALADLALQRHDVGTAQALFERVLALHVSPTLDRTAHVRLSVMALPPAGAEAAQRFLSQNGDDNGLRTYFLDKAFAESPDDPTLRYLLGRRLVQFDAHAEGLAHLDRALHGGGALAESLRKEALRLAIEAAWRTGDCAKVDALATEAQAVGHAFAARAHDWVERCHFRPPPPTK